MHLKVFDNFSLGKKGSKNKKESPAIKDAQAAKIAELEAKVNGKTKDLQKATEQLNGLKTDAGIAIPVIDVPVRPHGPAAELTLEPEDLSDSSGIKLDEVINDEPETLGEEIKIAEVTVDKVIVAKAVPAAAAHAVPVAAALPVAATAPAAPVEEKKEAKLDDSDSLKNLFSQDEEEENPLASLINSLPDVSVRELLDDIAEINRIIKEWQPIPK
jgi:hypothetical protein